MLNIRFYFRMRRQVTSSLDAGPEYHNENGITLCCQHKSFHFLSTIYTIHFKTFGVVFVSLFGGRCLCQLSVCTMKKEMCVVPESSIPYIECQLHFQPLFLLLLSAMPQPTLLQLFHCIFWQWFQVLFLVKFLPLALFPRKLLKFHLLFSSPLTFSSPHKYMHQTHTIFTFLFIPQFSYF